MSLSYHKRIHNSIKFCLISLCLILCNHHLPCPFPLLCADRPRLAVADKRLRKGIGLRYFVLPCQLIYVGKVGNKRVKFPYNRLIPCVEGGGLCCFPLATVGCFACSFALANLLKRIDKIHLNLDGLWKVNQLKNPLFIRISIINFA